MTSAIKKPTRVFRLRSYMSVTIEADVAYQQIAAPLVVLLWVDVRIGFALLLGAEYNAEIEKTWPHSQFDTALHYRL